MSPPSSTPPGKPACGPAWSCGRATARRSRTGTRWLGASRTSRTSTTSRTPRTEHRELSLVSLQSLMSSERLPFMGFIPQHSGYKKLLSYQKAEIVYDATVYFCDRFIDKRSRTHDQMIQAARSGKQNIIEGSMASATSKETEIKLTGVARASLEELLADYRDFLRTHGAEEWPSEHAYSRRLRELNKIPDATYATFRKGIENPDPVIASNVIIGLIHVTNY